MFTKARIKLTFLYVVIITLIIIVFSVLLFHFTVQHIQDNVEEDAGGGHTQQIIADRTISQLQDTIIVSDIIVILLAGLMSYFLSERTLKPIRTALNAQEQFSANASHELRTPLAVMKTENEVFLKNPHTTLADAQTLASSNLEEVNRMTDMVENLLVLARSKKSDMKIEMEQVDISKLTSTIVNNLQKSAKAKDISLEMRPAPSVFVAGNSRLLEQAISNIIQNAITYTEKGSIKILIDSGPMTTLKVIDTGIGISKTDLPHVLEPFFKVDASRNKTLGGMGLGLSIVKEIVQLHKGAIKVESEPNKGTSMTVILPTSSLKSS